MNQHDPGWMAEARRLGLLADELTRDTCDGLNRAIQARATRLIATDCGDGPPSAAREHEYRACWDALRGGR